METARKIASRKMKEGAKVSEKTKKLIERWRKLIGGVINRLNTEFYEKL